MSELVGDFKSQRAHQLIGTLPTNRLVRLDRLWPEKADVLDPV